VFWASKFSCCNWAINNFVFPIHVFQYSSHHLLLLFLALTALSASMLMENQESKNRGSPRTPYFQSGGYHLKVPQGSISLFLDVSM